MGNLIDLGIVTGYPGWMLTRVANSAGERAWRQFRGKLSHRSAPITGFFSSFAPGLYCCWHKCSVLFCCWQVEYAAHLYPMLLFLCWFPPESCGVLGHPVKGWDARLVPRLNKITTTTTIKATDWKAYFCVGSRKSKHATRLRVTTSMSRRWSWRKQVLQQRANKSI